MHTFQNAEEKQTVEFIFEILNGSDFLTTAENEKTHAHEIDEVVWLTPRDTYDAIRPAPLEARFREGTLIHVENVIFFKTE